MRVRLSAGDRQAALIRAACACLARGGMRAFTVDRIAAEARVSRGLIAHHFGSMDGLLVAVYAAMYGDWIAALQPNGQPDIDTIIDASVSSPAFDPDVQKVWLALGGEIAVNPALQAEHRRQYAAYRDLVATALRRAAAGRPIDAEGLATAVICLTDGMGVQRSTDPALLAANAARQAIRLVIGPHLGWDQA